MSLKTPHGRFPKSSEMWGVFENKGPLNFLASAEFRDCMLLALTVLDLVGSSTKIGPVVAPYDI